MKLRRLAPRWALRLSRSPYLVLVSLTLCVYVLFRQHQLETMRELFPMEIHGIHRNTVHGTGQGALLRARRNATEANSTTTRLSTTTATTTTAANTAIYTYASELTNQAMTARVLLAGKPRPRKVYLAIGIPTLKRPKEDYFMSTVDSLISQSTVEQQQETTLVVMLADRNSSFNEELLKNLKAKYPKLLEAGYLLVIRSPNVDRLFQTDSLKRTFDDSVERVRWRSKQNLDYAGLMEFAAPLSQLYLQLEDDVLAAPNYLQHIRDFVQGHAHEDWAGLEVCPHGFIGKLFKSADLPKLVTLLRTFYLEQPCDYLISHFYRLMVQKSVIRRKGTLFFHQGRYSSLDSVVRKVDKVAAAEVAVGGKTHKADNPPAELYTTLKVYKTHVLSKAYEATPGQFFWASDVQAGDTITVIFKEPQKVDRIVVESGVSEDNRRDVLHNASVEVGRAAVVGRDHVMCTNTTDLGDFSQGRFDAQLPASLTQVLCIAVVVAQDQTDWVILREIAVFLRASVSSTADAHPT